MRANIIHKESSYELLTHLLENNWAPVISIFLVHLRKLCYKIAITEIVKIRYFITLLSLLFINIRGSAWPEY